MDRKMDAWMDYRKIDEYIWIGGWMEGKKDRQKDGLIKKNGFTDRQRDRKKDDFMEVQIDRCASIDCTVFAYRTFTAQGLP